MHSYSAKPSLLRGRRLAPMCCRSSSLRVPWRRRSALRCGRECRPPAGLSERVSEPCLFARRLQDIESDTGYDTRRRGLDGAFACVSQTAVYDTGGSATPASQKRTALQSLDLQRDALRAVGRRRRPRLPRRRVRRPRRPTWARQLRARAPAGRRARRLEARPHHRPPSQHRALGCSSRRPFPPPIQLITGLVEPFSACLNPKMNRPTAWYYLSGCTSLIRTTCT